MSAAWRHFDKEPLDITLLGKELGNGSVVDKLASMFQNIIQGQAFQSNKPQSSALQTSPDQTGTGYDRLFHAADKFPFSALAALQTKKVWEKGIGEKFNVNSELQHVEQQKQLNQIALGELRAMYSRQYNGEKPNW